MNPRLHQWTLVATVAVSLECGLPHAQGADAESAQTTEQSVQAPERPVSLVTGDWNAVQKLVAGHKGKVVVVELWTTTCLSCVEEFPTLVSWQEKYGRERLACISVSCDYDGIKTKPPSHYYPTVLEFLKDHKARFDNVLLDVAMLDLLDELELSSTPAIFVYGRDGKLKKRFDNDLSSGVDDAYKSVDVTRLIDELLTGGT